MANAQGDPPRAFNPTTAAARRAGTTVRVDLVGDSTQTNHAGYGLGFCANLTAEVDCVNMSQGGASTKTYRELGLWDKALKTKPDYMLIQFGHNDRQTAEHLDRQVPIDQYEANLRHYVAEARAASIKPVLVTPLARFNFGADGVLNSDLADHAAVMRRVAADLKVPVVDLHADSSAYLKKLGEAKAIGLEVTTKNKVTGKTVPDKTHLNWVGSFIMGRIVAVDLAKVVPELRGDVIAEAAPLPPAGMKAMAIMHGGPVKIVLVGDSTVNAEGGWGKGFCAVMTPNVTCVNEALNGRSSKSFIDEGAWTKALADKGDYYLIQFGHNDQPGKGPERETDPATTYSANIRRYIRDVEAIAAVPVIITSLSRRNYKDGRLVLDLADYANAARHVAQEENADMIDLNTMSVQLLQGMTQEQADQLDAVAHTDQKAENAKTSLDRTHLNPLGQALFGRMMAVSLMKAQPELGPSVIGEPQNPLPTDHPATGK
jgi:lysophospholipase L1-like esterase